MPDPELYENEMNASIELIKIMKRETLMIRSKLHTHRIGQGKNKMQQREALTCCTKPTPCAKHVHNILFEKVIEQQPAAAFLPLLLPRLQQSIFPLRQH